MKTFKIIGLFALLVSFFGSCTDENNTQYDKGNQPLDITASKDTVILDALNPNSDAVKFSWTTGTNNGTGLAIEYTFQLDKEDGDFENGVSVDMGRNVYELSYKNEELNDLFINKFGFKATEEATFKYRVLAKVASADIATQVSPVKKIRIKSHKPITSTLYLIGDATPNGWDADKAIPLNAVTNTAKHSHGQDFLKKATLNLLQL